MYADGDGLADREKLMKQGACWRVGELKSPMEQLIKLRKDSSRLPSGGKQGARAPGSAGRWVIVALEAGGNVFLMASILGTREQGHQMKASGGGVTVLRKGDNVSNSHLERWNS